jgi:hypothetical protein
MFEEIIKKLNNIFFTPFLIKNAHFFQNVNEIAISLLYEYCYIYIHYMNIIIYIYII